MAITLKSLPLLLILSLNHFFNIDAQVVAEICYKPFDGYVQSPDLRSRLTQNAGGGVVGETRFQVSDCIVYSLKYTGDLWGVTKSWTRWAFGLIQLFLCFLPGFICTVDGFSRH